MKQDSPQQVFSRYYHFTYCDGLEALSAKNHKTAFPAHYHPTFNITLIYNGVFPTKLTDRLVLAPAGTILITNPREVHANPLPKGECLDFFTFYVSQDFLNYCYGGAVYFPRKTITDDVIFDRLHRLSMRLGTSADQSQLEPLLKDALAPLAKAYGHTEEQTETNEIELFNELLLTDCFEKFSLAEAANQLGIDKYKFLRLFKDQTGLTPNHYFIYKRIEKSKELLAEGHDLLSVAIDLGFYDVPHYTHHFKRFTGVTPMSFNSRS